MKIHRTLLKLEDQKYLEPLQSSVLDALVQYLKSTYQRDSNSNSTIMMGSTSIASSGIDIPLKISRGEVQSSDRGSVSTKTDGEQTPMFLAASSSKLPQSDPNEAYSG